MFVLAGEMAFGKWADHALQQKTLLPKCFPPDTLVGTERGLRPIREIEAGERVWAYDFRAGAWRLCAVECRHDNVYEDTMVTIDLGVGEVTATARHPFWVVAGEDLENRPSPSHVDAYENSGGSLAGRWVNSDDLRVGDVVFLRDRGQATIQRVVPRDERSQVCNLTVRELHTFAVGTAQVLVHNATDSQGNPIAPTRVTGKDLAKMRKEFRAAKPQTWIDEAARNPQKYTKDQLTAMKQGKAPIGSDGYKMEIHHKKPLAEGGTNTMDNFDFLTQTDHRRGANYKKNHPNLP